jgi:hypothetical protein
MDTKPRKGFRSALFYQGLVFAHVRKTQPGIPGYLANAFTVQQEFRGENPTARERNIAYVFAHRPLRKCFGG